MSSYDEILARIPTVTVTFPASEKEMEYPLNLICAILRCEGHTITLPADYALALEHLLYRAELDGKQKGVSILRLRFQKGMTFRSAGQTIGVTPERVRQIQDKAIRYFRHPARNIWLKLGIYGQTILLEEKYRDTGYAVGYKEGYGKGYEHGQQDREKDAVELPTPALLVADIEFSIRTFNSLKRAGCVMADDLIQMSHDELLGIRNVGKGTLEEIITKMRAAGYDVSHWENPSQE